jgi:2-polyprenyl-3-methyl-5-hydroxy-6-metoxy-1,4-benzoquinol methylase
MRETVLNGMLNLPRFEMSHTGCPLCSSKRVELLESIAGSNLRELYSTMIDISGLTPDLWRDCSYLQCEDCDLRFFDPAVSGDEKFYNTLQTYPWYYQDDKNEFAMAAAYLESGMRVLDVGAGKGVFKKYAPGCEYIGLEFSEGAQRYANERGVTIERKSIEDFSAERPNSMDAVCSFQVLEHVSRPDSFLRACVEALRPGGRLVVSVPAFDGFTGMAVNSTLNLPPHHVSRWSNRSLKAIASLYGLKMLSLEMELVQPIHAANAERVKVVHELRKFFGLAPMCIDFSIAGKVVGKIATLALMFGMRGKGPIHGHSAVAVYEK